MHPMAERKKLALTFDDGPDELYTPPILDILKAYKIKASFFLLGARIEKYPQIARRIFYEGHEMGNHSYDHPVFNGLTKELVYDSQIKKTQGIFKEVLGIEPQIYRPPYGVISDEQIVYLEKMGCKQVRWSVDARDWDPERNSPEEILYRILVNIYNNGIILLHSAEGRLSKDRSNTIKALPEIIAGLNSMGYQFCTVSEIPADSYYSREGYRY